MKFWMTSTKKQANGRGEFPRRKLNQQLMPESFKQYDQNVRGILNASEIKCEVPGEVWPQALLLS